MMSLIQEVWGELTLVGKFTIGPAIVFALFFTFSMCWLWHMLCRVLPVFPRNISSIFIVERRGDE